MLITWQTFTLPLLTGLAAAGAIFIVYATAKRLIQFLLSDSQDYFSTSLIVLFFTACAYAMYPAGLVAIVTKSATVTIVVFALSVVLLMRRWMKQVK